MSINAYRMRTTRITTKHVRLEERKKKKIIKKKGAKSAAISTPGIPSPPQTQHKRRSTTPECITNGEQREAEGTN